MMVKETEMCVWRRRQLRGGGEECGQFPLRYRKVDHKVSYV